ncbi:MAG: type II toxin-antitoxin system PrlF family antitoxin [Zoogloeaceae bacterium]|jgi:antitoxin PrlF|nr:type II toxin-antitoxin system PrlF family antitoxin [Zoogloeaceae bacterium]
MQTVLEAVSTLTDRYQTTVPEPVRRALHLERRDKIHYAIRSDGEVVLSRSEAEDESDPALEAFLDFLERDIIEHPEHIQPMDASYFQRLHALVAGCEIDLDAPLLEEDE